MNLENINLLSQKVDGVLATVRNLRQEVASLKGALDGAQADLQDKNLLLSNANAELADCKAALEARANQAAAQDDAINQKQGTIDDLNRSLEDMNAKVIELQNLVNQGNENLENAKNEISRLNGEIAARDEQAGQIQEQENQLRVDLAASKANESILNGKIEELNKTIAEKDAAIEALNAEKAGLNETIQAQGDEILQAQERFKQMVSTIETELGTEIPVRVAFSEDTEATPAEPEAAEEQPGEEPEEQPADNAAAEEEEPIEIHPANEKEPDLFASNGGSQTGFFG